MSRPATSSALSRRAALAGMAGVASVGLAGCLETLAARAEHDLPIRTVAVESDRDGEYYHPTQEHIESGDYSPLTRPLFIYVNHQSIEEKPALLPAFLRFFFEHQRELAREVGYYATSEEVRDENIDTIATLLEEMGIAAPDPDSPLEGEIVCSGSNTVAPVTRAAGEDFERLHPDVLVAVEPEGTGAGFAEFVRGNADIQSASRTILPEEAEVAEAFGTEYTRFEIGWDGLAIVVHTENDWLERITVAELNRVWDFGSGVDRWDQLRAGFPREDISLWGRDSASGTFDYFTEAICGEVGRIRTDYSPHTDTGSVMTGVAHSVYALGWGGVAYYAELKEDPFGHV